MLTMAFSDYNYSCSRKIEKISIISMDVTRDCKTENINYIQRLFLLFSTNKSTRFLTKYFTTFSS